MGGADPTSHAPRAGDGAGPSELPLDTLGSLVEAARDDVIVVSLPSGRVVRANQAARARFAGEGAALAGRPLGDFDAAFGAEELRRVLEDLRTTSTPATEREIVRVRPDGRPVAVAFTITRVTADRADYLLLVGRERPEAFATAGDLERPIDELVLVVDSLGAAVSVADARTGEVVVANRLARERFGTALAPRCCPSGPPGETYCPCADRALSECATCDRPLACQFETTEGDRHYWNVARPLAWADGRRVCVQVSVDVTARRRLEAENERLAAALQQAEEAILVTAVDGSILYASATFERMTGWQAADVVGRTPEFLKTEGHGPEVYRELWATLRGGHAWRGRLRNRRKDGSAYDADVSVSPVRDESGAILHFVTVLRDVTKEVERQAVLRQAHKMDAIATLADSLSHEFNNLLQPILGYASVVRDSLPSDDERRGHLDVVVRQARSSASLTRRLGEFGHGRLPQPGIVDVAPVVGEAVAELAREGAPRVRYSVVGADMPALALADAPSIRELVVALCRNAAAASRPGGTVRVALGETAIEGPLRTVNRELPAGEYLLLRVEDDGAGIAPEEIERLFEPHLAPRGGTPAGGGAEGPGLATVYRILQRNGGGVLLSSRPGEGTRVRVYVPAPARAGESRKAPSRRAALPTDGPVTVLVVDDEPDNVDLARMLLARKGFRVLTATDGVEALEAFEREQGGVDLVLLDVVMPRMDGAETFRELRQRNAGLPVIFVTGHDAEGASRHVHGDDAEFLFKPYTPADLLDRVLAVVGEPASAPPLTAKSPS